MMGYRASGLQLDPGRCALMIVDMQNDFVSPGGYHYRQGKSAGAMQAIIPNIKFLSEELPLEVKRIYIVTSREPDGSDFHWRFHKIIPESIRAGWNDHKDDRNALRGTWGVEIVDLLTPGPGAHVFYKRRYSAFYQTDLELCLRCWGIDTLIFTGVVTEICVESTIRDAFIRGFDVILVSDAVASWDREAHEASLRVVGQSFGAVLTASEIRNIL